MLVIFAFLLIIAAIYFPSRRVVGKETNLGKRHLENLDKIDPFAKEVIQKWIVDLEEELGQNIDEQKLNRLIGLKIAQARSTGELGDNFKELPKSIAIEN